MKSKVLNFPSDGIFSFQIFRYILSGSVACAIDYAVLATLVQVFKLYYLTSASIAFLSGLAVSYFLNIAWVFDRNSFSNKRLEAFLFFLTGIIGLLLNHYCIQFFTEILKLYYLASKLASTILVFVTNFATRKYIIFRNDFTTMDNGF